MPTYDYRCPKGHEFELFQRMSDEPRADCPECGQEAERLLSGGAGVLFKGEGFYITDYRSDDYRSKARAEKEARSGKSGKSEKSGKPGTSGTSGDAGSSGSSGSSSGGAKAAES